MIIKRENRMYGVGAAYTIQHSGSDSQKVTLNAPDLDVQLLYQGEHAVEVYEEIGKALATKKQFVDVDAIVEKLVPAPTPEPEAEPPATETPAEEAPATE